MRTLGLDLGDRTIGVAVSDELGLTAQGVRVIRRRDWPRDLAELEELVRRLDVGRIVVGLPRNMNGSLGPRAEMALEFARRLAAALSLEVIPWDERLTTRSAERVLLEANLSRSRRRRVIDMTAAVIILQSYLEARRQRPDGGGWSC